MIYGEKERERERENKTEKEQKLQIKAYTSCPYFAEGPFYRHTPDTKIKFLAF
jgi:hypothetical protein